MIRMFRRLRADLVHEGKARSYVAYALGEILLVIVGIVIALQVNNWNEERLEQRQVRRHAQALISDLERDIEMVAPIMRQAQVGIEDQRFYEHGALDLRGTIHALVRSSSGSAQGGSTLTQQYVKLALLYDAAARNDVAAVEAANSRTISRKLLELRYA